MAFYGDMYAPENFAGLPQNQVFASGSLASVPTFRPQTPYTTAQGYSADPLNATGAMTREQGYFGAGQNLLPNTPFGGDRKSVV